MLAGIRLRSRKRQLRKSLSGDVLLPPGWERWVETLSSLDAALDAPEPGWLIHALYWHGAEAESIYQALLAVAEIVQAPALAAGIVSAVEWRSLAAATDDRAYTDANGLEDIASLLARTRAHLDVMPPAVRDRVDQLAIPLDQALLLNAADIRALMSPPLSPSADPTTCAILALVAAAAFHAVNSHRDPLAHCAAVAITLLARAHPHRQPDILSRIRAVAIVPPALPRARAIRARS